MLKKIVILGPESTGKSTLCSQLADHYQTLWCPEYAREFLLKHGMNYTYDDLLTIAKGQLTLEDSYELRMKNLSRQEAALIAACLPNPKRLRVKPATNYVMGRSRKIMQQMSFLQPDPDIRELIGVAVKSGK